MVTFYRKLPPFNYLIADSIEELFKLLEAYGNKARIINGGTDIIPKLKRREIKPLEYLIDIKNIHSLDYIKYNDNSGLNIGALTTISKLENYPATKDKYKALYDAVRSMASVQVRNRGTIAGNICNAVPSADTAPVLLVLDADLLIAGKSGMRTVKADKFFTGPGTTVIKQGEILKEIHLPVLPLKSKGKYIKLTVRHVMELAIVGVAVQILMDGNACKDIKIGLGAVSPVPMRARKTESIMNGNTLDNDLIDKAADLASQECKPISDVRASAEYRRDMVKILTRRAILETIADME